MKKTILLLALGLLQYSANAQKDMDATDIWSLPKPDHETGKTTAGASRLIAYTNLSYNGVTFLQRDTTFLTYSGNRGGDFYNSELKYDLSIRQLMKTSGYRNDTRVMRSYDVNDNKNIIINQSWDTVSNSWKNVSKEDYIYNASNKELHDTDYLWNKTTSAWEKYFTYNNTYDASGNLDSRIAKRWMSATSTWDNYSKRTAYVYDASSNLKEYVTQSWNVTSTSWVNSNKYINDYDASNKIILAIILSWNNTTSTWDNSSLTRTEYNSAGNQALTASASWNKTSSKWDSTYKSTLSYDASNFLIGVETKQWSIASALWNNNTQTTLTVNSFGQRLVQRQKYWNAGGFYDYTSASIAANYYYEEYSSSNIKTLEKNSGGILKLFPVPAVNTINIDLSWETAQGTSFTIIDHLGRINMQWAIPAGLHHQESIDVDVLPSGNYFIQARGANGALQTSQFTIIK